MPSADEVAKAVHSRRVRIDREKHADLGYDQDDYAASSMWVDASHRSRRGIAATRKLAELVRTLAADQTEEIRIEINDAVDQILAETELGDVDDEEE